MKISEKPKWQWPKIVKSQRGGERASESVSKWRRGEAKCGNVENGEIMEA
jgi:hypothetical protein